MPESFKILGQNTPAATTSTDLLTVPGSTQYVVSTVVVANTTASGVTFRLSAAIGGAALTTAQYLFYDVALGANSSTTLTLGLTLDATDKLRVYASTTGVTFNAFGTAIT